jgi:hypothetical protein
MYTTDTTAADKRRSSRNLETGKRTVRSELKNVAEDKLQQTSVRG